MQRAPYVHLVHVLVVAFVVVVLGPAAGCAGRAEDGSLRPPRGAPPWEDALSRSFDDSFTSEPVNLVGRAPHDVLDQRLFIERLGLSSLVMLVSVEQVWARGRKSGDGRQFLDVRIERVLLGELPSDTDPVQPLQIAGDDPLPGSLRGQTMVLCLRWAPGADPPFHHHLVPATDDLVAWIEAAIEQARRAGAITAGGKASAKRAQRRARRRARRKARRSGSSEETP